MEAYMAKCRVAGTIVKTDAKGSFPAYLGEVENAIEKIAKKKEISYLQALHDCYQKFESLSGIKIDEIKEWQGLSKLAAIYAYTDTRKVFYQMVILDALED